MNITQTMMTIILWIGRILLALMTVSVMSAQQDVPRLRVANFMENPPAEALDFYLDDEEAPFASALAFADASASIRMGTGSHDLVAVPAGAPKSAAVFTEEFVVSADSSYMLVAVRTPGDTLRALVVTRPVMPTIPAGRLMAGIVHAAPQLGTVKWLSLNAVGNAMLRNDFWFGRTFLNGVWYFLPVDEGPLITTITGTGITANNRFVDQFLGPQIVWFVLTGNADDGTMAVYTVHDDDTLAQQPVHRQRLSRQEDGGVRIVNLVPDLPYSERGYVGQTIAGWNQDNAPFRATTRVLLDLLGPTVVSTSVGFTGPPKIFQVMHDTLAVNTDTLYTCFIVGTGRDSSASIVVLTTPFEVSVPAGRSLLRVLHAAPDIGPVDLRMKYGDGEETTVTNVDFRDANNYAEVSSGALNVQVYAAGTSTLLFERHGELPADSAWTLIVSGMKERNSLGINLLSDNDTNQQVPMRLLEGAATVGAHQIAYGGLHMTIAPNPAREQAEIAYRLERMSDVIITVCDMTGRVVHVMEQKGVDRGEHKAFLMLSGLASGSYQVAVSSDKDRTVARGMMVVLR